MGSKKFKILQAKWSRKLAASGFEDIEMNEEWLRKYDSEFQTKGTPEQFVEKQEYYQKAQDLLKRDIFLDGVERRIWALHSSGIAIRQIVGILQAEGFKRDKNQVNRVINEFQEMILK